ncbi:unnamed protein product [Rhodiola kirilowii]
MHLRFGEPRASSKRRPSPTSDFQDRASAVPNLHRRSPNLPCVVCVTAFQSSRFRQRRRARMSNDGRSWRLEVEHVIREQNIQAAYDILVLFCEFVLARVPVLESQKECPPELREAIASIVFAAPRCSDLPDLLQVRNLFGTKYGKEFVRAASELRPDTSVNRSLIEKLSANAPSPEARLELLKQIALEYNMNWDSSKTEAEFQKNHEDLLVSHLLLSSTHASFVF